MERHVKVAISIPGSDFVRLEKARKQLKMSRSKFMLTAVQRWFSSAEQQLLVDRYTEGYLSQPDDLTAVIALEKLQTEQLTEESW